MARYLLYTSLILFSSACYVYAASHSHYFFTTVTTKTTYDYPTYYETRSIDDITLYRYDSNRAIVEPRVPWFESNFPNLLLASVNNYNVQKQDERDFREFQKSMNDTNGFHYLQRMEGCSIDANGTISTVLSYRYDGVPFLTFSVETMTWAAGVPEAQHFADFWNEDRNATKRNTEILLKDCISHIAQLFSHGNCTFSRREEPVVVVTQAPMIGSTCILHCRAYGHYPKDISMTWYRNGEPVPETQGKRVTLPLPDITYLTWLSINITLNHEDVYTCGVHHSSMAQPFMEQWRLAQMSDEHSISVGGIIAIGLAVILLVVGIVFGLVSVAKTRRQ